MPAPGNRSYRTVDVTDRSNALKEARKIIGAAVESARWMGPELRKLHNAVIKDPNLKPTDVLSIKEVTGLKDLLRTSSVLGSLDEAQQRTPSVLDKISASQELKAAVRAAKRSATLAELVGEAIAVNIPIKKVQVEILQELLENVGMLAAFREVR